MLTGQPAKISMKKLATVTFSDKYCRMLHVAAAAQVCLCSPLLQAILTRTAHWSTAISNVQQQEHASD